MTVSTPSSVSSGTKESERSQQRTDWFRFFTTTHTHRVGRMRRWRHIGMIHQFALDHLMILFGISVVLAACSTASVPVPVSDPLTDADSAPEQRRDSDSGLVQKETSQQRRPVFSRGAESRRGQRVADIARKYVGTPYRWGGASPSGFDCSGLVRYVYAQVGVSLPHNAAKQYRYGLPVSRDRLESGDLVFFDRLRHSGIYIGGGRFIHSRQTGKRVSIASLDDDWYAEHWVGARRL